MKVLHITTHWQAGGSERNIKHHLECLRDSGHEVSLAVGMPQTSDFGFPLEVTIHTIPSLCRRPSALRDARALRDLKSLLQRERFDIVHTHLSKAGLLGRLVARTTGARTWHTVHGPQMLGNALYRSAERSAIGETDRMFFVGHDLHDAYSRTFSALPESGVIRSPVEIDKFAAVAPADPRAGRIEVLVVTRLVGGKGLERLPELAGIVPDTVSFTVVGDGPLLARLQTAAGRANLSHRLRFAGYVPDIARRMRDAHLLLNLSTLEGLPQVAVQAVAAGRPVVAVAANGVSEVVEDGVTGFVARPGDIGAIARHISALAADRDLLARASRACLAADLSQWHPATICRLHREAIAELLAAPPARDGYDRACAGA
ncbi:MAG: glycosyltransferase [Solirubrobacterales bacterium]